MSIYNSSDRYDKKEMLTVNEVSQDSNGKFEKFATNKIIPSVINTKIDFQFKKNISGSVMQAQPKVGSLFVHAKDNRSYKIKISRYLFLEDNPLPIEDLPKDVFLGWIGHELGHIQDYLNRSSLNLLGFGMKYYLSDAFITKAEIAADSYAVAHGLGEKIIATKNFVLNHDQIPLAYKQKIEALYLSPGEILSMVDPDMDEEIEENDQSIESL